MAAIAVADGLAGIGHIEEDCEAQSQLVIGVVALAAVRLSDVTSAEARATSADAGADGPRTTLPSEDCVAQSRGELPCSPSTRTTLLHG